MAIVRDYTPKDVMVISDWPLAKEEQSGKAYSEWSSMQLRDALINASILEHKNREVKYHLGVGEVCFTYLSLTRPIKGDADWLHSVVNKKNIPEGKEYIQCEWLKDVWVAEAVYNNILETIHQIQKVQPKLIICGGKWSLLFFGTFADNPTTQLATIAGTKTTIKKQVFFGALNTYRASKLTIHSYFELYPIVLIPILTPSYHWVVRDKAEIIRKDYAKAAFFYRRLKEGVDVEEFLKSERELIIGYEKDTVIQYLQNILEILDKKPTKIVTDVETKFFGIDCVGLCYIKDEAFTIPFTELYEESAKEGELAFVHKTIKGKKTFVEEAVAEGTLLTKHRHYWDILDEVDIMYYLQKVMLHPNCLHVGQNYLYDMQMYYREWKLNIFAYADTMIQHHCLYNYMQKDLALLASMYCSDYVYWKDEISGKGGGIRI